MQKLIIATIGLSLSMGVAAAAVAQTAATPGQMQTAPGTNGDSSTANPSGPASGSAPSTSSMQQTDPSNPNGTAAPGMTQDNTSTSGNMASPSTPPQSYPRCSATVHDECRQRS